MAVLPILPADSARVRQRSKRVTSIDGSVLRLVDDMVDTMRDAPGVGLAAIQIGVPLRVVVIEVPEQDPMVLINPQVVKRSGEREVDEGCLCLPGYRGKLRRSVSVTVKGKDIQGKEVRIKAEGLLAQALEHEIDHLNGVLYIDHLESPDQLHRIEEPGED